MTYRLEPGLARITSPIHLILPDHTTRRFSSGEELIGSVFDKRYRVVEMRAAGDVVEVIVEEAWYRK